MDMDFLGLENEVEVVKSNNNGGGNFNEFRSLMGDHHAVIGSTEVVTTPSGWNLFKITFVGPGLPPFGVDMTIFDPTRGNDFYDRKEGMYGKNPSGLETIGLLLKLLILDFSKSKCLKEDKYKKSIESFNSKVTNRSVEFGDIVDLFNSVVESSIYPSGERVDYKNDSQEVKDKKKEAMIDAGSKIVVTYNKDGYAQVPTAFFTKLVDKRDDNNNIIKDDNGNNVKVIAPKWIPIGNKAELTTTLESNSKEGEEAAKKKHEERMAARNNQEQATPTNMESTYSNAPVVDIPQDSADDDLPF